MTGEFPAQRASNAENVSIWLRHHGHGYLVYATGDFTFPTGHYTIGLFNTFWPKQNGRYFPDTIFKYIFLAENVYILLMISLKFVPKVPINNIPPLVQIMAWRRPGDNHYLNQWRLVGWSIYASLGLNELTDWIFVIIASFYKQTVPRTHNSVNFSAETHAVAPAFQW